MKNTLTYLFLFSIVLSLLSGNENPLLSPTPLHYLKNPYPKRDLVNSVEFHPHKNICCVTYTHNQAVILYAVDEGGMRVLQTWKNPTAQLSYPAYALFSKDGKSLIVSNWGNQTLSIYQLVDSLYSETPVTIYSYAHLLKRCRPHGASLSLHGDYLAVVFGVSKTYPRGVGLFRLINIESDHPTIELASFVKSPFLKKGIPKGASFSPDGSHLLLTLAEANSVSVHSIDWSSEKINRAPKEVITGLNRPEDIKFSKSGNFFAVSNSKEDNIAFFSYNQDTNSIPFSTPKFILQNPDAKLSFPHGIAFSSDDRYFAVTQFGEQVFNRMGNIVRAKGERKDAIAVYSLTSQE